MVLDSYGMVLDGILILLHYGKCHWLEVIIIANCPHMVYGTSSPDGILYGINVHNTIQMLTHKTDG